MNRVPNPMIAELAADLEPVRPIRMVHGIALIALAAIGTIVLVELLDGLWRGIMSGRASALFFIANGMFAMLGTAASIAVIRMASPHVGSRHDGARWVTAVIALLPVTAFVVLGLSGSLGEITNDMYGLECFAAGSVFGLITAISLVWWLRRGGPVSLNSAGTYTGIAAGAVGTFAYGLACPVDTLAHLGTWHVLPILLSGVIGRFAIPPLVRW